MFGIFFHHFLHGIVVKVFAVNKEIREASVINGLWKISDLAGPKNQLQEWDKQDHGNEVEYHKQQVVKDRQYRRSFIRKSVFMEC